MNAATPIERRLDALTDLSAEAPDDLRADLDRVVEANERLLSTEDEDPLALLDVIAGTSSSRDSVVAHLRTVCELSDPRVL